MRRRTGFAVDDGAYTQVFADERTLTTDSLDQAQKAIEQDFSYDRLEIQMEDINVDPDLGVRFNGHLYVPTEKAFADLCGVVQPRLPLPVAQGWPHDVAAWVLQRLSRLPQKTVIACVRGDVVVAFIDPGRHRDSGSKGPAQYRPLALATVLDVCKRIWKSGQKVGVVLDDRGLAVSLIHDELRVEPQKGDTTEVGVRITASETGGPQPVAAGFTLRLICTNGATLAQDFGQARFSTDPRVKQETRLERWRRELAELVPAMDLEVLRAAYERMAHEQMLDQDWYRLYRNVGNVFRRGVVRAPRHDEEGRMPADRVLDVSSKQRDEIKSAVMARQRAYRDTHVMADPEPTPWSVYQVMNTITAAAQNERPARRLALEELAGKLVHDYKAKLN
jgi:hypothetical protein